MAKIDQLIKEVDDRINACKHDLGIDMEYFINDVKNLDGRNISDPAVKATSLISIIGNRSKDIQVAYGKLTALSEVKLLLQLSTLAEDE